MNHPKRISTTYNLQQTQSLPPAQVPQENDTSSRVFFESLTLHRLLTHTITSPCRGKVPSTPNLPHHSALPSHLELTHILSTAYIDTSLVGTGAVDRAAIFSATGDSVWATSPAFNVSPTEMQAVVAAYKDPGNKEGVKKVQSEGLHIAGERFVVLKADDRSVYGKKVSWLGFRRVKSRVLLGCGVKGETLRRGRGRDARTIMANVSCE